MRKGTKDSNKELKVKFRQTKEWKEFRKEMKKLYKVDQLTLKSLRTGWNLHHCDMGLENYMDLDPIKFETLNRQSHESVHFLFRYYINDVMILERLKAILDKMVLYNKENNNGIDKSEEL